MQDPKSSQAEEPVPNPLHLPATTVNSIITHPADITTLPGRERCDEYTLRHGNLASKGRKSRSLQ
jgi:hypothetical protein